MNDGVTNQAYLDDGVHFKVDINIGQEMSISPFDNLSHLMGKPTICTAKLISAFVFATRIVQFLFYLNPKFQASSSSLCLYRPVCVGPVRKPHCWFSHEVADLIAILLRVCKSSSVAWFFIITKTCPCNKQKFFLALKIENFQLIFFLYIFLIFAQNIDCGYTLEPPRQGGSNEYPQSMF